jgi:hypothetical protein
MPLCSTAALNALCRVVIQMWLVGLGKRYPRQTLKSREKTLLFRGHRIHELLDEVFLVAQAGAGIDGSVDGGLLAVAAVEVGAQQGMLPWRV